MTTYDQKILQTLTEELYSKAKWIIATCALKYAIVALLLVGIVTSIIQSHFFPDTPAAVITAVAVILALFAGIESGKSKAFGLKLQAQQLLLQMQIERNTRHV